MFQINGVDVSDARHDQVVALLTGADEITLVVYRENLVKIGDGVQPKDSHLSASPSPLKPSPVHQGPREGILVQAAPVLTAPLSAGQSPVATVRVDSLPKQSVPQLQAPPPGRLVNQTPNLVASSPVQRQTQPVSPQRRTDVPTVQVGSSLVEQFNLLAKQREMDHITAMAAAEGQTGVSSTIVTTTTTTSLAVNHQNSNNLLPADVSPEEDAPYPVEVRRTTSIYLMPNLTSIK